MILSSLAASRSSMYCSNQLTFFQIMHGRNAFSMTFVMIFIFCIGYGSGVCDISQINQLTSCAQRVASNGGDFCSNLDQFTSACLQPLVDCGLSQDKLNQLKETTLQARGCQSSGVHFAPSIFLMFSSFLCFFLRARE